MNALPPPVTPELLLAMPDGKRFELVDGDLVETHVSTLSSWVGGKTFRTLADFAEDRGLGTAWPADCGLQCFPDDPKRVRKPDVMYIGRERYPIGRLSEGFLREVPDLVVEVISANDLAADVERKIGEYLSAGVGLIWIIDPETRIVRIQRGDGSSSRLTHDRELSGEDVIPGFTCRVRDLFPPDSPPA
jgi:Uma2 family endonuclease